MKSELLLVGLDGANPLAFLAALGTLRTLSLVWPDEVKMSWQQDTGAWRPVLHMTDPTDESTVIQVLTEALGIKCQAFDLGENLAVPPDRFRDQAIQAQQNASPEDRCWADFLSAFGCEITTSQDSKKQTVIQDTELRTMSGAGHQNFLSVVIEISNITTADHLHNSLFEPWQYTDAVEKHSMRWDPIDDSRYALRWRNPSGDPSRRSRGNMLGANRLAIEGMPLMPVMPRGSRLRTTGFTGMSSKDTFWTWPIWEPPLGMDAVRSVLALDLVQRPQPRSQLAATGICEVYKSQRLTIGKYRSFAPAQAV